MGVHQKKWTSSATLINISHQQGRDSMTMLTSLLLLSAAFALGDANLILDEDLCPHGWTKYGSSCLMFVKTTRSWPEAERHCVSLGDQLVSVPNVVEYLGANLASVHSSEEDQFLQALVLEKTVGFPPTWIGGFLSVKDRRWFWSDGSDFDHQNWAKGRPDAGARDTCIHINFGGQHRWNNELCVMSLPSVCSLRLLPLRQTIH